MTQIDRVCRRCAQTFKVPVYAGHPAQDPECDACIAADCRAMERARKLMVTRQAITMSKAIESIAPGDVGLSGKWSGKWKVGKFRAGGDMASIERGQKAVARMRRVNHAALIGGAA